MGAWVGKYEKKAAVTGCGSSLQMWNPKDVGLVRKRRISRLLKRNSFLLVQLVVATKSFFLSKTKFWLSSLEQTYGLANENSIICWCTMAPLCDVEWQGTRLIIIFLLFQSTRVTQRHLYIEFFICSFTIVIGIESKDREKLAIMNYSNSRTEKRALSIPSFTCLTG